MGVRIQEGTLCTQLAYCQLRLLPEGAVRSQGHGRQPAVWWHSRRTDVQNSAAGGAAGGYLSAAGDAALQPRPGQRAARRHEGHQGRIHRELCGGKTANLGVVVEDDTRQFVYRVQWRPWIRQDAAGEAGLADAAAAVGVNDKAVNILCRKSEALRSRFGRGSGRVGLN